MHIMDMSAQFDDWLAVLYIPEHDGRIVRAAGESRAVRAECERIHAPRVPGQRAQQSAVGNSPESDHSVGTAAGESVVIGAERERQSTRLMSIGSPQLRACNALRHNDLVRRAA